MNRSLRPWLCYIIYEQPPFVTPHFDGSFWSTTPKGIEACNFTCNCLRIQKENTNSFQSEKHLSKHWTKNLKKMELNLLLLICFATLLQSVHSQSKYHICPSFKKGILQNWNIFDHLKEQQHGWVGSMLVSRSKGPRFQSQIKNKFEPPLPCETHLFHPSNAEKIPSVLCLTVFYC